MTSNARAFHLIGRLRATRFALALLLIWVSAHTEVKAQNSWQFTNGTVECLAINAAGHIFAGTASGRVFRSTNNGESWASINTGLPNTTVLSLAINASGYLFAQTGVEGIFRSTNNGESWTPINTELTSKRFHSLAISLSGHIFAGTSNNRVFRSADNGDTWIEVDTDLPYATVMCIAINASRHIFAGTDGYGVFRSTNNGDSWTKVSTGLTDTSVGSLIINARGHIFARTYVEYARGERVLRSKDNGGTWMPVDTSLTSFGTKCLAINTTTQEIFAGTSDGIFRSTNNGDSWMQVNTGWTDRITSLAINTKGHIFAGTFRGTVFRSTNNGDNWTPVNTGLSRIAFDTSLTLKSVRIRFKRGETDVKLHGHLAIGETKRYVLSALVGQIMRVVVQPSFGISLVIVGRDGTVLNNEAGVWRGKLPATQDYFIDLTLPESSTEDKDFDLSVLVNPPGQATQWFTYRDEDAGIEFDFSDYFISDTTADTYTLHMNGETVIVLNFIGSEFYEGTNLGRVYFFVGASEAENDSCCIEKDDFEHKRGKEVINSVTYSKFEAKEGNMHQSYNWEIYRTVQRGAYYEVGFFITSVSTMVFDPESDIRGFDYGGVYQKLREVLSTFKIIKH